MEERVPFKLSEDFHFVLDQLENTGQSFFITGRAGTGKSTLLRLFKSTTRKKVVVLAPTGVAALNAGGQTIHSFFGFPPRLMQPRDIKKRRYRKLYENLEVLVIDEISMVRADLLDHIDLFLRINRDDPRPFGGVQLAFFGDLFQLPPVVANPMEQELFRTEYESPYFFSAHVMREVLLPMIELQKVYRQEERRFLSILEGIRLNRIDYDLMEEINERHQPDFKASENHITLSARNRTVDQINERELSRIPFPEVTFGAKVTGSFNPNLYPTENPLRLKEQAQVMFIKNDPEKNFVNGTIGKVTKLTPDSIEVTITDQSGAQRVVEVQPMEWEVLKYQMNEEQPDKIETKVMGTYKQYPLKLAWAITIHKSQGKTFDRVIIDMGRGAFEHGQTYVALSRCRTLDGIVLKQPLRPRDILIDERVVEYYESNQ
jgi:ATP-dependent DNA helicase PIF1